MERGHFHCQYKKFTRSKGQSAVRAAAYRLAARMKDERTGQTHDYTRKGGVDGVLTVLPAGVAAPAWARDPSRLWSEAEAAEKDNPRALVMHEWEIALPHQLSPDQRKEAAREMAQFIADRYGCVAMAAFHSPNRNGDHRNHHIHLMFTTRAVEPQGFARQKFRHYSLRAYEADATNRMTGAQEIVFIKSQWAAIGNRHLERAGFAPGLDHRSYAEQGLPIEPEKHLGPDATARERRGERTAKGDFNRAVRDRNRNRQEWARAWREARIEITGQALPHPSSSPTSGQSPASGRAASSPPLSTAFLALMDNQRQERDALVRIHIAERRNLWLAEQERRQTHKQEWVRLYRRQRAERTSLHARFAKWPQRILRKLDFTGRLRSAQTKMLEEIQRRQQIERARLGRIHRAALQRPATRLQDKHAAELLETDHRHIAQRRDMIGRERRNEAILRQSRRRDGPGRGR